MGKVRFGVLPDTSAWIAYLRQGAPKAVKDAFTEALFTGALHVFPVVLAELVQGARSEKEALRLKENLLALPKSPSDIQVWVRAGELGGALRQKGLTLPLSDLAIAASAELGGLELWHADRHFEAIALVADLRLRPFYSEDPR